MDNLACTKPIQAKSHIDDWCLRKAEAGKDMQIAEGGANMTEWSISS